MRQAVALTAGVAAWLGVAIIAVLVVNAWADDQQVVAIFPIAAAVIVAWAIGEWVTEEVFGGTKEDGHGNA